ncbi:hypothetical protein FOA52_008208 [Chlamydomonas sp. UWO 241]|nr:hypothetical protein FOA52_008208 [Chlamydomonas sp. UWO 241]
MATTMLTQLRSITKVVQGSKQMEGAGVQICRTIGSQGGLRVDPYLMLDELKLPAKAAFAGFPDHPHRGFETCSIMLEGEIEHRDSVGNKGVIRPGGVQWMTAGRGIIHSEMPRPTEGILHGFQLWINLPAKDKMCKPRYQDYQASDIPIATGEGVSVRVMAGESLGTVGPIKMRNPGMLLDVRLSPNATLKQSVPSDWNGFCYVYAGSGTVSGSAAKIEQALLMGAGDHVEAVAGAGSDGMRFLLIAGRPIGEPIVQHGPFVMNTREEIQQAFTDYQVWQLLAWVVDRL